MLKQSLIRLAMNAQHLLTEKQRVQFEFQVKNAKARLAFCISLNVFNSYGHYP